MAYPISAAVKAALDNASKQGCSLTITKTGQTTITLTDSKVFSLAIDRASTNSSNIEIGTAIATELSVEIDNRDGSFDNYDFEGAQISASVIVASTSIPLGYFIVYEQPEVNKDTISLLAYDRMTKFDKVVTDAQWSNLTFPCTVAQMIVWACDTCGVNYRYTTGLPNRLYQIDAKPETKDVTFRQLISWCCEIQGCCAYFDYQGYLAWGMYNTATPAMTLGEGDRYTSNVGGKNITITGIKVTDSTGKEYLSGNDSYGFNIKGNDLLQGGIQAVVNNLGAVWNGFTYRSTLSTTHPYPHLFPCDTLTYTYKNHSGTLITVNAIVSRISYIMNGRTTISGKGETASVNSQNNYSSYVSSGSIKSNMLQVGGFTIKDGEISCGGNGNLPVGVRVTHYDTIPSVSVNIGSVATSPYIIFAEDPDTPGVYEARIHNLKIFRTSTQSWVKLEDWLDELDM